MLRIILGAVLLAVGIGLRGDSQEVAGLAFVLAAFAMAFRGTLLIWIYAFFFLVMTLVICLMLWLITGVKDDVAFLEWLYSWWAVPVFIAASFMVGIVFMMRETGKSWRLFAGDCSKRFPLDRPQNDFPFESGFFRIGDDLFPGGTSSTPRGLVLERSDGGSTVYLPWSHVRRFSLVDDTKVPEAEIVAKAKRGRQFVIRIPWSDPLYGYLPRALWSVTTQTDDQRPRA